MHQIHLTMPLRPNILLTVFTLISLLGSSWAQERKKDKEIPKEQIPVEERDTGDSLVEDLVALPGKIIVFPLKLLFLGASKTAGFFDVHSLMLKTTDLLTNEDGTRRVRPVFTPAMGGGLTFIQDNFSKQGLDFRALGTFGLRSRRFFSGGLIDPRLFSSKFGLELQGFYQRLPDEDFFGIGNHAPEQDETNYLHRESNLQIAILSNLIEKFIFSLGFVFSNVDIFRGRDSSTPSTQDVFSPDEVPGLFGAEMGSLVFSIYRDSRNRTGNPTRGGEAYFSFELSKELGGSEFGYRKFILDLRRYVHLFYNRVLVLRARTEITDGLNNRETPFFRLSSLGGRNVFRGFRSGRFRDNDSMVVGLEYRFPIYPVVDAVGFGEEGRVFSDLFDRFSLHDFKYAIGGGLRFHSKKGGLVAIVEITRGSEGIRFSFSLNEDLRKL
ncbi:MAG: BamA/TamA family outer membrane protein [bacterium]